MPKRRSKRIATRKTSSQRNKSFKLTFGWAMFVLAAVIFIAGYIVFSHSAGLGGSVLGTAIKVSNGKVNCDLNRKYCIDTAGEDYYCNSMLSGVNNCNTKAAAQKMIASYSEEIDASKTLKMSVTNENGTAVKGPISSNSTLLVNIYGIPISKYLATNQGYPNQRFTLALREIDQKRKTNRVISRMMVGFNLPGGSTSNCTFSPSHDDLLGAPNDSSNYLPPEDESTNVQYWANRQCLYTDSQQQYEKYSADLVLSNIPDLRSNPSLKFELVAYLGEYYVGNSGECRYYFDGNNTNGSNGYTGCVSKWLPLTNAVHRWSKEVNFTFTTK